MIEVTKYKPVIDKILATKRTRKTGVEQDLEQECYLALLERQNELGGDADVEKATVICKSRIKHFFRLRKPGKSWDGNPNKLVSADDPNIARQIAKIPVPDNEFSELYEAIDALDPNTKEIIIETSVKGHTRKETARELGISEGAVQWGRKSGIRKLKEYFEVENGS